MNTDEIATKITRETASRVSKAKTKAGLTDTALALEIGTPRTTLVRKLQGSKQFTTIELHSISRALNIPLGDLLPLPNEVGA